MTARSTSPSAQDLPRPAVLSSRAFLQWPHSARTAAIKQSGVNLIVLLALSDSGHPAFEAKHAEGIASLGCPVFACTPDQFPSMMASVLTGKDLQGWAAEKDIALIRGS